MFLHYVSHWLPCKVPTTHQKGANAFTHIGWTSWPGRPPEAQLTTVLYECCTLHPLCCVCSSALVKQTWSSLCIQVNSRGDSDVACSQSFYGVLNSTCTLPKGTDLTRHSYFILEGGDLWYFIWDYTLSFRKVLLSMLNVYHAVMWEIVMFRLLLWQEETYIQILPVRNSFLSSACWVVCGSNGFELKWFCSVCFQISVKHPCLHRRRPSITSFMSQHLSRQANLT